MLRRQVFGFRQNSLDLVGQITHADVVRLQLVRGTLLRRRAVMLNCRAFARFLLSAISVCLLCQENQRAAAAKFVFKPEHRGRAEDVSIV